MTVQEAVHGSETVTPNGTRIKFETHPRRQYWVNNNPCPSATEVLDVLGKPLVSWGQGIGVEGVLTLIRKGRIGRTKSIIDDDHVPTLTQEGQMATKENVTALLKELELDHNAVLKAAQDRGTAVHKALEAYVENDVLPDPSFYPEHHQGYIRGLTAFLTDVQIDRRAKVFSEVRVGSIAHGYAGTFDLLCKLKPCTLKTTPIKKEEEFTGRFLLDAKTSSSVWPTHHYQLRAYAAAAAECGYPAVDACAVVRFTEDGLYEVKRTPDSINLSHFLAIKAAYDAVKGNI